MVCIGLYILLHAISELLVESPERSRLVKRQQYAFEKELVLSLEWNCKSINDAEINNVRKVRR